MKGKRTLYILSCVVVLSVIPMCFTMDYWNESKIDLYLFADHLRWPENIAYDLAEIITVNILVYGNWFNQQSKEYKRYVGCFFASSLFSIPGYFLFYSQFVTLVTIPSLIVMLLLMRYVNVKERNHAR